MARSAGTLALQVGLTQKGGKRKADALVGGDVASKEEGAKLKSGRFDTLGNLSSEDIDSGEDG